MRSRALDSAAEVYAIAKFYADEGDPELLRRVRVRLASMGVAEEAVLERIKQRADALIQERST